LENFGFPSKSSCYSGLKHCFGYQNQPCNQVHVPSTPLGTSVRKVLDEAVCSGGVKKGQTICLPVFGGRLTWGSALLRW